MSADVRVFRLWEGTATSHSAQCQSLKAVSVLMECGIQEGCLGGGGFWVESSRPCAEVNLFNAKEIPVGKERTFASLPLSGPASFPFLAPPPALCVL